MFCFSVGKICLILWRWPWLLFKTMISDMSLNWILWSTDTYFLPQIAKEMIKPNNLVFLWPREWYWGRKPPAGCFFVSGFLKAVHIMAPGTVLSYFHQNWGSERGQAGTNGHDCTSLLPVSQYIFLSPTSCTWKHVVSCCCFLEISERCSDPGAAWEMWWVYKWVSLSITSTLFAAASSRWPHHSLRSDSAVSLLLSVTPSLPACLWQRCPAMCHWSYLWEKNAMCPWSVLLTCCAASEELSRARTAMDVAVGGRVFMQTFPLWGTSVTIGTEQLSSASGAQAWEGLEGDKYVFFW